jgi:hypothetical protein
MVPPYQTRVEMAGQFQAKVISSSRKGKTWPKLLDYAGGFKRKPTRRLFP